MYSVNAPLQALHALNPADVFVPGHGHLPEEEPKNPAGMEFEAYEDMFRHFNSVSASG